MELTLDFLVELLDYASDEIYVLDMDAYQIFTCENFELISLHVIG